MAYISQSLLLDGSLVLSIDEDLRPYASEWMPSLPEVRELARPAGQAIRIDSGSLDRPSGLGDHSLALGRVKAWLHNAGNQVWLESETSSITGTIDLASGVANVAIHTVRQPSPFDLSSALTIAAGLLLVRKGRTPVHAGAVVHPDTGRAWVLVGDTHAGKSTTTANLVRAGWFYLSDDYVVLSRGAHDEIIVEGWPDDFHLDEGWHSGEPTGVRGTTSESDFREDARKGTAVLDGILFPRVEPSFATSIAPVAGVIGLERIIRQSPWLVADPVSARGVLELMRSAASRNTADIRLGRDTFANPSLLDEVVRGFVDQAP
ncbi:MAG TPA: hypothetical protein VM053_06705 [Gemmatimonadaceae bacterium]|nr:hypothetical protein [Gemmatimonadaceae bacterium]